MTKDYLAVLMKLARESGVSFHTLVTEFEMRTLDILDDPEEVLDDMENEYKQRENRFI